MVFSVPTHIARGVADPIGGALDWVLMGVIVTVGALAIVGDIWASRSRHDVDKQPPNK